MKVGLYFGTFNPIHVGHLIIANHFAEYTDLDQIWCVVTPQNPFKAKQSILNKDIKLFGELMKESHLSYAKDFDASTEDVDQIVERSISSGAEGARLTGGGFGGFTVSLIHSNNYSDWKKNIHQYYDDENVFEV